MTTRTYCDNCGNTVRTPHKYAFGSYHNFVQGGAVGPGTVVMMAPGNGVVGAGQHGTVQQAVYYPSPGAPDSKDFAIIDLCDRCRPIWMNRVKALTESSEPDKGGVNGS